MTPNNQAPRWSSQASAPYPACTADVAVALPGWVDRGYAAPVDGAAGVTALDYYANEQMWFEANVKAMTQFPDVMFLPGFWSEYGMCTEPSAFALQSDELFWEAADAVDAVAKCRYTKK